MSQVLGVIVVARAGDRTTYYQDPRTYAGSWTSSTPLGATQSFALGKELRSTYLSPSSPSYIAGISSGLVDNSEIKVRVKAGGESEVIFDSAIALLQGLYPPDGRNKETLADGTVVSSPLGGYQYVPVETVEPSNDRSMESWTDCPAFQKHVAGFYDSDEFKAKEKAAQPFFTAVKDFVFGRPTTLENIWNINDFVQTQLLHNKTYAYRLPPTLAEQSRGLADWKEKGVFSGNEVANVAGRTLLHTVLTSLERIAFNGDNLQFLLLETGYQPFISFFDEVDVHKDGSVFGGIPDPASALAIELRRGSPPDVRDFLRFQFKNGTSGSFETLHVFGHHADIPLTEFIFRAEKSAIRSNKDWMEVCHAKSADRPSTFGFGSQQQASGCLGFVDTPNKTLGELASGVNAFSAAFALVSVAGLFMLSRFVKRTREKKRRVRLEGQETLESGVHVHHPMPAEKIRFV